MQTNVELAELVTTAEIARMLNVSPQRAHQLSRQPRFPQPVGTVGQSQVWRSPDIERWSRQRAKEQWIADAVALVPRTGGILQSMFRSTLQDTLAHALGSKGEVPRGSVADVVQQALDLVEQHGVPRFDPALLKLDWPTGSPSNG